MTRVARTPALIEDALHAAARTQLPPALLGGAALTAAVIDRSRRYTSERDRLRATGGAAAADLAARALFFTVADAGKLPLVLAELTPARAPAGWLTGATLRVLDVGAGCGAMTLGLLVELAARGWGGQVVATLLDRDAAALAIARAAIATVAAELAIRCAVTTHAADVAAAPGGPFELVVAGTVVNELADGAALVRQMIGALAPDGVAVVIEPALRDTARGLHAIRDAVLADGAAAVLAPCTRRAAPCPALADERDWCHDHYPAELPPRARQLAAVTGLRDGDAKFAFLALARAGAAPPPLAAWRVVDDPHAPKGKVELTACGAAGWVPVRLLRRHRAAPNRAVERAHRGDLLAIDAAIVDGRIELGPDDTVAPIA